MNRLLIVALLASIGLSACGKKEEAVVASAPPAPEAAAPAPAAPAPVPAPVAEAPAAMPNAMPSMPAAMPATKNAPVAAHPAMPVAAAPNSGKVVQILQAGGYTYAEVESGGRKVWIAGSPIQVKAGDIVQWGDYSIMQNFNSKTLNRTFDEILFVNAWGPAGAAPTPVAPHGKPPVK
ncbi:MAG: hypothetical protein H7Z39_06545 [Burkholderiaceae bacterium]|nr:hypothetical protein [Burkholderiaceae bacterium]